MYNTFRLCTVDDYLSFMCAAAKTVLCIFMVAIMYIDMLPICSCIRALVGPYLCVRRNVEHSARARPHSKWTM